MRRAPLAALILLAVALSLTAAACEPSDDGIATDTVRIGTVTEVVDVPASVTAKAVATLTAAADGTIAALRVAPGTPVKKGAVLAVIDSPTARKRLADAKAALAAAGRVGGSGYVSLGGLQQNLDSAANDAFAAARTAANQVSDEQIRAALLAQVTASQQRYESVAKHSRQLVRQVQQGIAGIGEAVQALGEAQRVQARAAYDLAKATVDALTMRAPIAGVVQFARPATASGGDALSGLLGSLGAGAAGAAGAAGSAGAAAAAGSGGGDQNVAGVDDVLSVGDRVSAGTPILSIVDISEIGLAGEVDETDVLLVSPGVAADVELDAAPGFSYHATVQSVDLLPTPSARGGVAYRVRLTFQTGPANQPPASGDPPSGNDPPSGEEPPPTPRPGMSAVAHLRVRTATDAMTVPAAAVFSTDQGDAVWLVQDGVAVRRKVEVGVQGADLVAIESGLSPGQRIVISGADKVSAGQAVK